MIKGRAAGGAEIDLVLALPNDRIWAIEVKRSLSPKVDRGFHAACQDLNPQRKFVVYPGMERLPLGHGVEAIDLTELARELSV